MVEKKVKEIDPEYYSVRAVEKKYNPLFSGAKTRKSKDVQVAKDCKQEYKDRDVHLLFFDPAEVKGAPQIVLRRGSEEMDVYCRTIVAVSSPSMSLDMFQYLFGCRNIIPVPLHNI